MSVDQALDQFSVGDVFRASKCWLTVEVTFQDAIDSSVALFRELNTQYEQLVAKFDSSIEARQDGSHCDFLFPMADFLLLLRNCLAILPFLEFGDSSLLEKHGILVSILGSLCSSDLRSKASRHKIQNGTSFCKEASYASMCSPDGSATQEQVDSSICFPEQIVSGSSFLCSIFEVFLNELLVCQELKHNLLTAVSVCSAKKIFISHCSVEDSMLELISGHFLMSVCDEWAFEKFHNILFWSYGISAEIPQLSLAAAMTFLGNLAVTTAPKIFQAHLVSLVSSCIGISIPSSCGQMTPLLLSTYMSAFEESVNLYNKQMVLLLGNGHSIGVSSQSVCQIEPSSTFESHVRPETYAEINLQIGKLLNSFQRNFRDAVSESRSDLMSASMAYINESKLVLDESCRVEACRILNCMIQRSLVEEIEVKVSDKGGEISQHDVYLLASTVKLMSCSLLQIIWFMQKSLKSGSSKVLKDSSPCGEYGFLIGIIKHFVRYSANRSIQKTLKDVMNSSPAKHKESKFILMHFAGVLSFCFDRRLEFLWKGCLFMLMAVMNLFMLEEGNLDALKPLLGYAEKPSVYASCLTKLSELKLLLVHSEEPSCYTSCLTNISKGLKHQRSSRLVALNWQKIQMVYMKKRCKLDTCDLIKEDDPGSNFSGAQAAPHGTLPNALDNETMEGDDGQVQNEDEICNGEDFLKCRGVSLDQDGDLADFIACKPGKDYASWWKRRQRYRTWKHQLQASKQKMRHEIGGHGSQGTGVT